MSKKTILLIEDESEILLTNREFLELSGYNVLTAETLAAADIVLKNHIPDLVLLDINLPDGSGLDFIVRLRESAPCDIPVIFLTARRDSSDMIAGLERGGCDYITKPYDFGILAARIGAQLRAAEASSETIRRGELSLNLISQQAYIKSKNIVLTKKEFSLLLLFVQNEGKTMGAEYIYERVWGHEMSGDDRALKYQISNLRGKIVGSGYVITAVRGSGYCFEYGD